ncbi:putative prolyl-tRNA synthetase [Triangularia verruculosa]|uniref:proline--tRNA ligase n=1 Tax=Triangularia verruculosa TaxID=2587418 RepID=A0AAN6XCD8_9PEZI|nr:putative prolyl-tRNA synthetase [Triangularia verruculosa]
MISSALARLSRVWFPTKKKPASGVENGHAKLIRAGFLRPSHAGIFHMLPLGRRVQSKLEDLVASHMEHMLAASRVSLSAVSSQSLWEKSGRLENTASELFKFSDRKDVGYLLAPTHEEEITTLVAQTAKTAKDLPLRLFQITPKYRDEFRPRHGLLRGREFVMKDLYTFDNSIESALATYNDVRQVYSRIFEEMKLPVLAAKASSGNMGGNLSHEYHLPTPLGEDHVVSCDSCDYVANEEVAESVLSDQATSDTAFKVWRGITKDRTKLVNVWYPKQTKPVDGGELREYTDLDINTTEVKSIVPDLDAGVEDALPLWSAATAAGGTAVELINIVDCRLPRSFSDGLGGAQPNTSSWPGKLRPQKEVPVSVLTTNHNNSGKPLNIIRIHTDDKCPSCTSGHLKAEKAMELGHTFYLGTRYSEALGAIMLAPNDEKQNLPMQMGCYGIGISRIIGAVAELMVDDRGLNWPLAIAPYSCVIVTGAGVDEQDAVEVYRQISQVGGVDAKYLDVVLDDRQKTLPWKLMDADLAGFPVIVTLGREWLSTKRLEVQCRRLGVKQAVEMAELPQIIAKLHTNL